LQASPIHAHFARWFGGDAKHNITFQWNKQDYWATEIPTLF